VFMWVKYTVPRVRIDHMLSFNWKFLTPFALLVVLATAFAIKLFGGLGTWPYLLGMLAVNILIAWATLTYLRTYAHLERRKIGEPRPVATPDLAKVSNP
jgi:hypothetical protein